MTRQRIKSQPKLVLRAGLMISIYARFVGISIAIEPQIKDHSLAVSAAEDSATRGRAAPAPVIPTCKAVRG
jgi:hypothetical protein